MKSLRTRMILLFGLVVAAGCAVLWYIAANRANAALEGEAKAAMLKVAEQFTAAQESRIELLEYAIEDAAADPVFRSGTGDRAAVMRTLAEHLEQAKKLGFKRMAVIDKTGKALFSDGSTADLGDREHFKKAMQGKTNISSTLVSKVDQSVVFSIDTPIRDLATGQIIGALLGHVDADRFAKMVSAVTYARTGYAFAVDSEGKTIAHKDAERVLKQEKIIEAAKNNPDLAPLAAIVSRMAKGEAGVGEYTFQGEDRIVAFAPIKSTGWSIGLTAPRAEVLERVAGLNRGLMIASAVILLIILLLTAFIARSVALPIKLIVDHLGLIAGGDFTMPVPEKFLRRRDEIGRLAQAIDKLQADLRPLLSGLKDEAKTLAANSESLSASSEEIASSSGEVSNAIQQVASGASDQAKSLQEVVNLMSGISSRLERVDAELKNVKVSSEESASLADTGKEELNALIAAIDNVRQAFGAVAEKLNGLSGSVTQVGEITGVITGIAEQTNLLALNAAIEAARAGEAGRGFAVVAEEVRKLAEQSRASADKIKGLLDSISAETSEVVRTAQETDQQVNLQVEKARETARAFDNILNSTSGITPMVAAAFREMEDTVKARNIVFDRMHNVSAVSEETSAAAEEIAASTEELTATTEEIAANAQQVLMVAKRLEEQVAKFKV